MTSPEHPNQTRTNLNNADHTRPRRNRPDQIGRNPRYPPNTPTNPEQS